MKVKASHIVVNYSVTHFRGVYEIISLVYMRAFCCVYRSTHIHIYVHTKSRIMHHCGKLKMNENELQKTEGINRILYIQRYGNTEEAKKYLFRY